MTVQEFLRQGVTPYQTAECIERELAAHGYAPAPKTFVRGGRYLVRSGCGVFAVAIGKGDAFHVAACHTDSPCFRFKQAPDKQVGKTTVWLTEPYGGAIRHGWLDRRLGIAGAVSVATPKGAQVRVLVLEGSYTIPSVAIHFNRTVNDSLSLNAATDFNVLGTGSLTELVARQLGVNKEDILTTDLRTFVADEPYVTGRYLVAPRIDNLTSAYSILTALTQAEPKGISVAAFFDLEEVGSSGRGGADSTALSALLERISRDLGIAKPLQTVVMSVDNAHGEHPLHPELTAGTDCARMGEGIVLKYNANLRYSTELVSGALVKSLARAAGVGVSVFSQRSDLPCGSTLGVINLGHVDAISADIGIAQLAMHAASEVCDTADVEAMTQYLTAFFRASIQADETGVAVEL